MDLTSAVAWESLLPIGQTAGVAARQRNCLVIPLGVQSTAPSSTRRVEVYLGTLSACWRGELILLSEEH